VVTSRLCLVNRLESLGSMDRRQKRSKGLVSGIYNTINSGHFRDILHFLFF